jgi:predicted metal-dependent HD superfamily phosphohydrolase
MNFAGPGTRLDCRLNDDGTPKSWSKPTDRVDQAAYYHDLAYNEYKDTENRNIADREMLQQLDSIENPSVREKIEMAIIKPVINTKQRFGLGLKDRVARDFRFEASRRLKR